MDRLLLRTNAALQDCERHLATVNAYGTEIESYLTQYLLVTLCADVQQEVYRIAESRALASNDSAMTSFVASSSRKVLRSVGKSDIANFVEMFGPSCKAKFNDQLIDSEITTYSNAVGSRHDVAHKQGSLISFREIREAVIVAEKLLAATFNSIAIVASE